MMTVEEYADDTYVEDDDIEYDSVAELLIAEAMGDDDAALVARRRLHSIENGGNQVKVKETRQLFSKRLRGVDCDDGNGEEEERAIRGRELKKKKKKKKGGGSKKKKKKGGLFKKSFKKKKFNKGVKKFSKSCKKASRTVSKHVTKVATKTWKGSPNWLKDGIKDTGDFASDVGSQLAKNVENLADDIVDIANKIGSFFNGLRCNVSPNMMKKIFNSAFSLNPSNIINLKDKLTEAKNMRGANYAVQAGICATIWSTLEVSNPIGTVMMSGLTTLTNACPALKTGNPAVSIGVSLEASAEAGYFASAGMEFGIAIDSKGSKMCYIGGCIARGYVMPPTPAAGADAGVVFSVWGAPGNIPGESQTMSLDINANLPLGATGVGVEAGAEYIFAPGDMSSFLGIALSGSAKANAPPGDFPAKVGFGLAHCYTPVCITTQGKGCSTRL